MGKLKGVNCAIIVIHAKMAHISLARGSIKQFKACFQRNQRSRGTQSRQSDPLLSLFLSLEIPSSLEI